MAVKTNNNLYEALKEFKEACDNAICNSTMIIIGNGEDLFNLDMKTIPRNVYFISDMTIPNGVAYEVVDKELKLKLIDFCYEYPDRVFKGEK